MDKNASPPDEAYGRVTAPERYLVVHAAADALIETLTRRYEIVVTAGESLDMDPGNRAVVRTVRLDPARDDAAAVVIAFTDFPGLLVRFGSWHSEAFPNCGCDACDESPDEVIRELRDRVAAVVDGRFREERHRGLRPSQSVEFIGPDGVSHSRSWTRLDRNHLRHDGRGRRDWQPWPLRGGDRQIR